MKKAVIYARYSAGPKQTDMSIQGQTRECKKYIEAQGYSLFKIYADKHISGKTDKRPEFQKMISDAEDGLFDIVVVYSLDRFSRDPYDGPLYKKKLRDAGVSIESSQEHIPEGPEGILMEKMLEGLAAYYSEELSRKIKRGMHDTALKCKSTGSYPPIGYKVGPDKTYIIDEKVAPYIRTVFNRFLSGATYAELCRYLNDEGLRTSRGKEFGQNAIRRMLSNKKYKGVYSYAGVEIESGMPIIIDEETFNMVQERLNDKQRPHSAKGKFLLSGKIYCGLCGKKITGISGTSKTGKVHYYYACKNCDRPNLNRDLLEAFVAAAVQEAFSEPQELDSLADKLFDLQVKEKLSEVDLHALAARLNGINDKRRHYLDLLGEGRKDDFIFDEMRRLEDEKKDLEFQIEQAKIDRESIIPKEVIKNSLEAFLSGAFARHDDEQSTEQIREAFVHRVDLYENYFTVEFNIRGLEGLKTTRSREFDQSADWWR